MVVVDKSGVVTWSGSGNDIHYGDLRAILEVVAGPPIPGKPDLAPTYRGELQPVPGNFDGLVVKRDPLLRADRAALLAAGLRENLDSLYQLLELGPTVLLGTSSSITFYADLLRYAEDSGAPYWSTGLIVTAMGPPHTIRMYVRWFIDLETTLATTRHELVHALIRLKTGQNPPLWFDEGIADALSRLHPPCYFTVDRMRERPQRPAPAELEAMWSRLKQSRERQEARAVGHAVVDFVLHRYGMAGLNRILTALGTSGGFPSAVQQGLGISLPQLMDDFWADVPKARLRGHVERAPVPLFTDLCGVRLHEGEQHFLLAGFPEELARRGAVTAFPDGSFRPHATVTRAELGHMLMVALDLPEAVAMNLTLPGAVVTRAEAVAMIIRAAGVRPVTTKAHHRTFFADMDQVPSWARAYVIEAAIQSVIGWQVRDSFGPKEELIRSWAAVWTWRASHLRRTLARMGVADVYQVHTLIPPGAPAESPPVGSSTSRTTASSWAILAGWLFGGLMAFALGAAFLALNRLAGPRQDTGDGSSDAG